METDFFIKLLLTNEEELKSTFVNVEQGSPEWKTYRTASIGGSSAISFYKDNKEYRSRTTTGQYNKVKSRLEIIEFLCREVLEDDRNQIINTFHTIHGTLLEKIHPYLMRMILGSKPIDVGIFKANLRAHFSPDNIGIDRLGRSVLFEYKTPWDRIISQDKVMQNEHLCQIYWSRNLFNFDTVLFSETPMLYVNSKGNWKNLDFNTKYTLNAFGLTSPNATNPDRNLEERKAAVQGCVWMEFYHEYVNQFVEPGKCINICDLVKTPELLKALNADPPKLLSSQPYIRLSENGVKEIKKLSREYYGSTLTPEFWKMQNQALKSISVSSMDIINHWPPHPDKIRQTAGNLCVAVVIGKGRTLEIQPDHDLENSLKQTFDSISLEVDERLKR